MITRTLPGADLGADGAALGEHLSRACRCGSAVSVSRRFSWLFTVSGRACRM
jgi:hypothetical protein